MIETNPAAADPLEQFLMQALPTWDDASNRAAKGEASEVDTLVDDNEPAGDREGPWRARTLAAFREAQREALVKAGVTGLRLP